MSFDNTKVGELQGQGLAKCLGAGDKNIVYVNGSPTDNNATLFAAGAHSVLDPMTNYKVVAEQAIPDWDNQVGGTTYEQMYTAAGGKIDGVLAANDGLGNAVIAINKKNGVQIPVTGQDATVQGLQNILAGDQCMTVFKDTTKEAAAWRRLPSRWPRARPRTPDTVKDTTVTARSPRSWRPRRPSTRPTSRTLSMPGVSPQRNCAPASTPQRAPLPASADPGSPPGPDDVPVVRARR